MPTYYHITVRGHLDARWSTWFDGLTITPAADGTTILNGAVRDQTALHGLIAKVRDLGLPLIAIEQCSTVMDTNPAVPPGRPTDLSP